MAKKSTGSLDAVNKEVKKLVAEIAEIPEKKLKDDANFFDDLGIDSMKSLEIVASIEKKFKVRVPESKIPTVRSLNDIYALLATLKK